MRRAAIAGLVTIAALASGCPHPVGDDGGPTTDAPAPTRCGDGHERIADLSFVPRTAVLVGRIDLGAADLDAALVRMRDHVAQPETGLPVRAAFALGQWHWEVPLVRDTLARQGLATGELVALALDDALGGWIVPLGCAHADAIAAVRAHGWSVEDSGVVAIAAAVPERTAWDLVIGPGPLAVLAPAGRGRELAARLGSGADPTQIGAPTPGERLAAVATAPVRVVVIGRGFTMGDATTTSDARALRASPAEVEDVRLADAP
ncbi:MAG TPA: hypothetical protein VFG69_07135 [Nannocystaceae bacterium]|nr:hypothetical protein [Nannocystaceae bacterium]